MFILFKYQLKWGYDFVSVVKHGHGQEDVSGFNFGHHNLPQPPVTEKNLLT